MSESSFSADAVGEPALDLPPRHPGPTASMPAWRLGGVAKALWRLFAARSPGTLFGGLLAALLRAGVLLCVSVAIGRVASGGAVMAPAVWAAVGLLAAAALGHLGQRVVIHAIQDGLTRLREQMVDRLLSLPVGTVQNEGVERFMLAMTRDGELVNQMARACFGALLPGIVLVLLCLCGIVLVMPALIVPLVSVLALLWLARRRLSRRLAVEMALAHEAIDQLYERLRATALRHELAVSHANEPHERQACQAVIAHSHVLMRALSRMQSLTSELDALVLGLALLGLVTWLASAGAPTVSGASLASVLFLMLALRGALQSMLRALQEMAQGAPALAGIERLLALSPEPPHDGRVQPTHWRMSLEGVSCRVGTRTLIRDASLTLEPGRITVLTGANGTGKTTLLRLVLGLHTADGGTVHVDGVPWARIDRSAFRQGVGYLPQTPVLFAGTVYDNITYATASVAPQAVQDVMRAMGLGVRLTAWPDGLTTRLGPAGSPLSGGERQRVALARVLLREPRLLVLDEPTNHLDGLSAQALMSTLRQVPGRPAVFIISHDPTLIEQADQGLEMVDGRLRVLIRTSQEP